VFASLAAVAVLVPAGASATAPVLQSVTVVAGQATVKWSLPACVEARLVETATPDASTGLFGYFIPNNVYSFDVPRNVEDTALNVEDPLTGSFGKGTYYAHVGGVDRSHPPPNPIEFSNLVQFNVDSFGYGVGRGIAGSTVPCPHPAAGTVSGGKGPVTTAAPFGTLSYARVQSIGKLFVTVHTTAKVRLKASGTVSLPGAAKVYRFKRVTRKVGAAATVKLRLRLSKKNLKAVRRALKRKRGAKARITVTATDGAGAAKSQRATIKLKP
jgi:hypothetical protein